MIAKYTWSAFLRLVLVAIRVSNDVQYDFSYCGNSVETHMPSHELLVFELQTHAKSTGVFKLQL